MNESTDNVNKQTSVTETIITVPNRPIMSNKNRHERRKEASIHRKYNKKLKGTGYEWVLDAFGNWCLGYDVSKDNRDIKI